MAMGPAVRTARSVGRSAPALRKPIMRITRHDLPIILVNAAAIAFFTALSLRRENHEFLLYIVVILVMCVWFLAYKDRIAFDSLTLWGLTLWGVLHMAGGNIEVGDGVLYGLVLAPIWPKHSILRYDQAVHAFGFGVATMVGYQLLNPLLRPGLREGRRVGLLLVLIGCGIGAGNEIIEFVVVLALPRTGVGGYENTMWDLVFNFIGTVAAVSLIAWRRKRIRLKSSPCAAAL